MVSMAPSPGVVTQLLQAWGNGDAGALEQLTPLVEAELAVWPEATWHASGAATRYKRPRW